MVSRKNPKTLSGIETLLLQHQCELQCFALAGKTLNPYQGLKLKNLGHEVVTCWPETGKTLNPYQGLKLALLDFPIFCVKMPEKP